MAQLACHIRLKASSIIEVIIALLITAFVFSIGIAIHLNVVSNNDYFRKHVTAAMIDYRINMIKKNQQFISQKNSTDRFTIEEIVTPYKGASDLLLVEIIITDKTDEIINRQQVIVKKKHD